MSDIRAEDLTEETLASLSGSEYFVMFDNIEGKKTLLSVIADYVAAHGTIDSNDLPTILEAIKSMIAEEYDTSSAYAVGDLVWHENALYACTTATSAGAFNPSKWTQTDVATVLAALDTSVAAVDAKIGNLASLTTTAKTNVVAAINELKSGEDDLKEDLNSLNISDLEGIDVFGNRIPYAVKEYYEDSYWYVSNGEIKKGSNSSYDAYKVPIADASGIIYFKNSPGAFVTDANDNVLAGAWGTYVESYDLSALNNPAYLCYTNHKGISDTLFISENISTTKQNNFIKTFKNINFIRVEQTLTPDNNRIVIPNEYRNSVMQNMVVSLNFDFSQFNGFELGFMDASLVKRLKLQVLADTITYTLPSGQSVSESHGLTFSNNIQMIVKVDDEDNIRIELTSNGVTFVKTWTFRNQGVWRPYADVTNITTKAVLAWSFNTIDDSIWCFGDSYFAYDPTRWVYYLSQAGYQNNCLIDGYGGRGSAEAYTALVDLLKISTPKTVFWCLGMNDGNDSSSAPSVAWKTYIDKVITLCKQMDVKLVLATIPTVPTVNNEKKNEYVRNSGYQYVDFAKAVGATAEGVWFTGMLSNDGVHPATQGGIALYNRVICDFPQIVVNN